MLNAVRIDNATSFPVLDLEGGDDSLSTCRGGKEGGRRMQVQIRHEETYCCSMAQ